MGLCLFLKVQDEKAGRSSTSSCSRVDEKKETKSSVCDDKQLGFAPCAVTLTYFDWEPFTNRVMSSRKSQRPEARLPEQRHNDLQYLVGYEPRHSTSPLALSRFP